MTDEELLKTPLRDMTPAMLAQAVQAKERKTEKTLRENKNYKLKIKCPITPGQTDSMDPIKSHADGKYYSSKAKYYKEIHARGLAITEKGMVKEKKIFNEQKFNEAFKKTMEKLNVRS